MLTFQVLLFIIYPFHAELDARKNFVRNRSQLFCQFGDRDMFPENLHLVPDGGIRVRDIDHAGIHADVADDRNSFPFDEHVTDTITQMAV